MPTNNENWLPPGWTDRNVAEAINLLSTVTGLDPAAIPGTLDYLMVRRAVANGECGWVEHQIRPDVERWAFRWTKAYPGYEGTYYVDRPADWDPALEQRTFQAFNAMLDAPWQRRRDA